MNAIVNKVKICLGLVGMVRLEIDAVTMVKFVPQMVIAPLTQVRQLKIFLSIHHV